MRWRNCWFLAVVAALVGGADFTLAAAPVVDGHCHEGLTVTDGTVDTSKLEGLRARGLDAAVVVLPVDRSRPADLEARVRDEVGQLRRACPIGGVDPAADTGALVCDTPRGPIRLLLSVEWFHGIFAGDATSVRRFADLGVRMIGLAEHDADGLFGTGDRAATLTPFGRQVIAALNDAGVVVDVTHLSHAQKLEVIARSRAPVVASHSLVRAVSPDDFNLPDEVVTALASNGGSVWVSFNRSDLLAGASDDKALDRLVANIEVLLRRLGPDRVGIGTDLQKSGAYAAAPLAVEDTFAQVRRSLEARGHPPRLVDDILGGNVLRALAAAGPASRGRGRAQSISLSPGQNWWTLPPTMTSSGLPKTSSDSSGLPGMQLAESSQQEDARQYTRN